MSPARQIKQKLKEEKFELIRRGKHEVYSNGKWNVTVPTGSKMTTCTLKAVLQHIEGKGPFFAKQQANIRQREEKKEDETA